MIQLVDWIVSKLSYYIPARSYLKRNSTKNFYPYMNVFHKKFKTIV